MILAVIIGFVWVSLIAQAVKNLPSMQEMWVQSLAQENPLEEEMATHSSIVAWKIPWTDDPAGCSPGGRKAEAGEEGRWGAEVTAGKGRPHRKHPPPRGLGDHQVHLSLVCCATFMV